MTVPNCKAWDPAFAGELAVIVDAGMREMLVEQRDCFHYITVGNENYGQPTLPGTAAAGDSTAVEVDPAVRDGVLRGMYRFRAAGAQAPGKRPRVQLLGAGAILREALAAADLLADAFDVQADVWSVTSFSELARDGMRAERAHRMASARAGGEASGDARRGVECQEVERNWVERSLGDSAGPIVAATDYVRLVPESIRAYLPAGRRYVTLGTDGFGRSDARFRLRAFFEVDARSIAYAAVVALCDDGALPREAAAQAAQRWEIGPGSPDPWTI
jgi:pyruvate dehydrogenase E1 component